MTLERLLLALPALILLAAGGCAPLEPISVSRPAPSAKAPAAAADDDAPAPASEPAPRRHPRTIATLAKAALKCEMENDAFATDCPAFKAWDDEEALFAGGKGDDAIFEMLGDEALKVRILATRKSITHPYWEDEEHARALFALAKAERDDNVAQELAGYVALVDADKMGLGGALKRLARHPSTPFRRTLASHLLVNFQTPAALEVDQILIDDDDTGVKESAVNALAHGGSAEPVCKLLTKLMGRSEAVHANALFAGTSSECAGMKEQVAAELQKRIADLGKVTNAVGVEYALAASGLCSRGASPELKKKGIEIGKKLSSAKVTDSNTRNAALDAVVTCDPKAGAALLLGFLRDKAIGESVQRKLAALKKQSTK